MTCITHLPSSVELCAGCAVHATQGTKCPQLFGGSTCRTGPGKPNSNAESRSSSHGSKAGMRFLHTTFIQPVAQTLVLYSIAECKSSALLTCRDAPPVTPDCLIASLSLLLLSTWTLLGTVLSKLCLLPVICGKIALIVLLKAKSTYPASQSQFLSDATVCLPLHFLPITNPMHHFKLSTVLTLNSTALAVLSCFASVMLLS